MTSYANHLNKLSRINIVFIFLQIPISYKSIDTYFCTRIKVELLEIYMVILHKYKHNAILVLKKIYIHKSIMQIHIVSVLDFL